MNVHNVMAAAISAFCCGACAMNGDTPWAVVCGALAILNLVICFER